MLFHTMRRRIYVAVLAGGAVPFIGLSFAVDPFDNIWLFSGVAAVLFASGWGLAHFAALAIHWRVKASGQGDASEAGEGKEKSDHAGMRETATYITEKTRRLLWLTEEHQQRAAQTTSATAEVTENASIIAGSISKMTGVIQEIGHQADKASQMVETAVSKGEDADKSVTTLAAHMDGIISMAEMIGSVAKRTNLLSLNATIEAAHAGEHGRGFTVVAQEVKALANQTARATTEIQKKAEEVRAASRDALEQIKLTRQSIQQINSITHEIRNALEQQTLAVNEIALGTRKTSAATEGINTGVAHLLVTTEQVRLACEEIALKTKELKPGC